MAVQSGFDSEALPTLVTLVGLLSCVDPDVSARDEEKTQQDTSLPCGKQILHSHCSAAMYVGFEILYNLLPISPYIQGFHI